MDTQVSMPPLLRAVMRKVRADFYEARLLELDLVVSGTSAERVFDEIEHAILVAFYAAKKHGQTVFHGMVKNVSEEEEGVWLDAVDPTVRPLSLPNEVIEALATALQPASAKPGRTVAAVTYAQAA